MDFLPPQFPPILPISAVRTESVYLAEAPVTPAQPVRKFSPSGMTTHPQPLALPQWQTFQPGPNNAITDVSGVQIGQVSIRIDYPVKIRTGVTVILPEAKVLAHHSGQPAANLANLGFPAAVVNLNGNGELTGDSFINEFGVLNGPIVLTNTRSVGIAYEGVIQYFQRHFPGEWGSQLPVVGECWDGFFSDETQSIIPSDTVEKAISQAQSGPVLQGQVGAGTGMRSFELHAGIGTASRKIKLDEQEYTIGVLVNTNHSRLKDLNPVIRQPLESLFGPLEALKTKDSQDAATPKPTISVRQGSIQVIIATDLPLNQTELKELGRRAGLGIGHTGSAMGTTSGDFVTAFSTANPISLNRKTPTLISKQEIHPDAMTPVFKATIEAVVEAQINALIASHN